MTLTRLYTLMLGSLALILGTATLAPAQEFPLTIDTKFGPAVIAAPPERVATIDYAGADNVLALGFQPLTVRAWFGPEDSLWPWTRPLTAQPPVVIAGELDFEAIAATEPDVILAMRSGITDGDYARLAAIAPVIAVPPGAGDWDLTWQEQAMLVGRALGREAEAEAQIAALTDAIAATGPANPDWAGRTFAMLTWWNGSVYVYTVTDSSVRIVEGMGLTPHPRVRDLSMAGQSSVTISEEILPEIDADVIFWWAVPENIPVIEGLAARTTMRASAEGREIILPTDSLVNGALANGSLLSLPVAIDLLTPMIAAAIDGDPATPVSLN
jgi:iron complex transport system substrate-binding protein